MCFKTPPRCDLTLGLMFICARHPSLTLLLLSQKANQCFSLTRCERDKNSAANIWNSVHNCLLWTQALLIQIWFCEKLQSLTLPNDAPGKRNLLACNWHLYVVPNFLLCTCLQWIETKAYKVQKEAHANCHFCYKGFWSHLIVLCAKIR